MARHPLKTTAFLDHLRAHADADGVVRGVDRAAACEAAGTTPSGIDSIVYNMVCRGVLERVSAAAGDGRLATLRLTGTPYTPPSAADDSPSRTSTAVRALGLLSDAARGRLRREFGIEVGPTRHVAGDRGAIPITLARVPVGEGVPA